jgi:hypothetical protein
MTNKSRYRLIDAPADGSHVGQDCGTFEYNDLPERVRTSIDRNPSAIEWVLPALSGGDSGQPLKDLVLVVQPAN